eukprot:2948305-Amphidinium_carterae.1
MAIASGDERSVSSTKFVTVFYHDVQNVGTAFKHHDSSDLANAIDECIEGDGAGFNAVICHHAE